jgi:hypothetical protein
LDPNHQWFVIADDDSLFNMPRLRRVLASYDSTEAVYLGERYGHAFGEGSRQGYDYVTMGGGGGSVSFHPREFSCILVPLRDGVVERGSAGQDEV